MTRPLLDLPGLAQPDLPSRPDAVESALRETTVALVEAGRENVALKARLNAIRLVVAHADSPADALQAIRTILAEA